MTMLTDGLDDLDVEAPLADVDAALASDSLTQRQVRTLLVRHAAPDKTQAVIARLAGVPQRTLQYWIARPFFGSLWHNQAQRYQRVVTELRQEGVLRSLKTLIAVQGQDYAVVAASVQVDAASKLLTAEQRAREHETVSAGEWMRSGLWRGLVDESRAILEGETEAGAAMLAIELEAGDVDAAETGRSGPVKPAGRDDG